LPEAFLATDVILNLIANVSDGLQVWPNVIRAHIKAELPFMATENVLMACVKAGGDRQALHEAIREHSMEAGRRVKEEGAANDLMERIATDMRFQAVHSILDSLMDPTLFVGRSPQQVDEFVCEYIDPILASHADLLAVEDLDQIHV
jgi:adenylosuccinate lyase